MAWHLRALLVVTLGAAWVLASLAVSAPRPPACLTLRVTNCYAREVHVASGPVTLCADVRVQLDDAHRLLTLEWDYAPVLPGAGADISADDDPGFPSLLDPPEARDGVIGSEQRTLEGAQGSRLSQFILSGLSGGTYAVVASVYSDARARHLHGRARAEVIVQ